MAVSDRQAALALARDYGIPTNGHSDQPVIMVGGQHAAEVDNALEVLRQANHPERLFLRGGIIVRLKTDEDGRNMIEAATEASIRLALSRAANFQRGATATVPPRATVEGVLAHDDPRLPALAGVTEAPVFRLDGSLAGEPGYDKTTRTVYSPTPDLRLPDVSARPGLKDIARARDLILVDLLGDFPFESQADRANAVSLLLERPMRSIIPGPYPLHVIDKPQRGTGAGLLVDVISTVVTGRPAALRSYTNDESEMRKALTTALLAGSEFIVFDNVEGTFSSAQLSKALTSTFWADRLMGSMRDVALPNLSSWIANGNNLAIAGDLGRRTCLTRLNAKVDRPYLRSGFRHPRLLEWADQNRGDLLWAVLTLCRNWLASGRPAGPSITFGGYQSWADAMSGILAAAGIEGFMENALTVFEASETEAESWAAFLGQWSATFGSTPVAASTVARDVENNPGTWNPVLPDLGDARRPLSSRLGYRLRKFRGVVFSTGLELQAAGKEARTRQALWAVVPVKSAKDASPNEHPSHHPSHHPSQAGADITAKDAKDTPNSSAHAGAVRVSGNPSQSFHPSHDGASPRVSAAESMDRPEHDSRERVAL